MPHPSHFFFIEKKIVNTKTRPRQCPSSPDHATLTSPTGGGRSVSVVHLRTKATGFSLITESKSG
jgi:hypothetical protein